MEDLNKNAEPEKPIEVKNESKKLTTATTQSAPKKPVARKIPVQTKEQPTPTKPVKSTAEATALLKSPKAEPTKVVKTPSKPASKPIVKTEAAKSPEKKIAEPKVQNAPIIASAEVKEMLDSKDKAMKLIEKKAKKAEKKVDKLKKKVKKAKKKEVKKSKIKDLKEKLGKALKKFKASIEKLKEEKK